MADNARVYVGGLPYAATEEDVKAHFSAAGQVVSVFLPKEPGTGRMRGFGFVEFSTPEEQQNAIQMFNQTDFNGRQLFVEAARPRAERP